ncbi:hypothetical protein HETIRDRAFT_318448 [Heterobasidion irregulare TC 32-1]|uniref:Palmitoyltransferase n=1 Tax=Heterobasidion irregulare (strain TC 32-1) TaxID=747525 RepID=W4K6Q6_HETIT|nr:uncharacterized protein HETIRDRAFT_318448 [Heterobasidion irregulare TC 32-1]ETW81424.1 hypothetical protein HETIRDRAFT_318448 [Heterobasidion irregulare TC 32-1]
MSELQQPAFSPVLGSSEDEEDETIKKRWYHFLPLCCAVLLLLAPHPSLLYVLVNYHLLTLHSPLLFSLHLCVTYALTFLAFCSLIVCVARDPGPVPSIEQENEQDSGMSLTDALMAPPDYDYTAPGKWCRVCWAPKHERTHHCSQCGRCVLKMDHHCPWIGGKCIGHRTYPSFLHFLFSITLLSVYIAAISIQGLSFAFRNPLAIDPVTPVNELFLAFAGVVFTMVIGSFFCYHIYLVLTNQTTIENISPFILLRHLPPLPPSDDTNRKLSNPPIEHELSYAQRRLVKDTRGVIRLYDLGWRNNLEQTFGPARASWRCWAARMLWGGQCGGDGIKFPVNPRAEDMLARLAVELVRSDQ